MKHCLVGQHLPHTLSPLLHGMLGDANYCAVELDDVAALRNFLREGAYDAFNVTIPFKQDIMPMLDGVSSEAQGIGAVNTVVRRDGKYIGYNTDVYGMKYAMDLAGIDVKGKRVLVLGSGGTSHTARYLLGTEGAASVKVASRSGSLNYANVYDEAADTQVIINTTPVGMYPNVLEAPIALDKFLRLEGVFDCIYNPLRTRLVLDANRLKIRAAGGLAMLVAQAVAAQRLFAHQAVDSADLDISNTILDKLQYDAQNITLVGMAGSGKSVVGKMLAKKLGRQFVDTDVEVQKAAGMSVPEIFEKYGEAEFRRLECEAVKNACLLRGCVIAAGGGAVLDENNRLYMRCLGKTVWLKRDYDSLATCGRPLSKGADEAKRLAVKREPLYMEVADICVNNDGEVEDAVNKIAEAVR